MTSTDTPAQTSPTGANPVRVRFAPSPTGDLHLGSALVALANAAFVRAHDGVFVLRIDDTDRERSDPALIRAIIDELAWLGVSWDEGPYLQSDRSDHYQQALDQMIAGGHVYPCFCRDERLDEVRESQRRAGQPPRYDGACRDLSADEVAERMASGETPAMRLRVPARDFTINDMMRGSVAAPVGSFGDFILQRGSGAFMYQFASVIDDIDLQITHVIRGEDHLANTARQLAIFDAMGVAPPAFAHLPLLRSTEGRKLAKRDPLGTLGQLRDQGYLPEVIRRYLAELLGVGDIDLLASDAAAFAIEAVSVGSSPMVDPARLASLGREASARGGVDAAQELLAAAGVVVADRWIPVLAELLPGTATTSELVNSMRSLIDAPSVDDVRAALERIHGASGGASHETLAAVLSAVISDHGLESADASAAVIADWKAQSGLTGGVAMRTLRALLTGADHGPPLGLVMVAIGTDHALSRTAYAAQS